jgi:hypothetical protein
MYEQWEFLHPADRFYGLHTSATCYAIEMPDGRTKVRARAVPTLVNCALQDLVDHLLERGVLKVSEDPVTHERRYHRA